MADETKEQWLCVGYSTERGGTKMLHVFSPLEGGHYNEDAKDYAYSLKRKCVVGGIYDVPVTRNGERISITPSGMVFKGFYQSDTVAVLRAQAEAFEHSRKAQAAERKYKRGDGLPDTVAGMAKIYAKADWSTQHALEQLWLIKLRREANKLE